MPLPYRLPWPALSNPSQSWPPGHPCILSGLIHPHSSVCGPQAPSASQCHFLGGLTSLAPLEKASFSSISPMPHPGSPPTTLSTTHALGS